MLWILCVMCLVWRCSTIPSERDWSRTHGWWNRQPLARSGPEILAGVAQQDCNCVDIRLCPETRRMIYSQTFDRNFLRNITCAFQGFIPFVCCDRVLAAVFTTAAPQDGGGRNRDDVTYPWDDPLSKLPVTSSSTETKHPLSPLLPQGSVPSLLSTRQGITSLQHKAPTVSNFTIIANLTFSQTGEHAEDFVSLPNIHSEQTLGHFNPNDQDPNITSINKLTPQTTEQPDSNANITSTNKLTPQTTEQPDSNANITSINTLTPQTTEQPDSNSNITSINTLTPQTTEQLDPNSNITSTNKLTPQTTEQSHPNITSINKPTPQTMEQPHPTISYPNPNPGLAPPAQHSLPPTSSPPGALDTSPSPRNDSYTDHSVIGTEAPPLDRGHLVVPTADYYYNRLHKAFPVEIATTYQQEASENHEAVLPPPNSNPQIPYPYPGSPLYFPFNIGFENTQQQQPHPFVFTNIIPSTNGISIVSRSGSAFSIHTIIQQDPPPVYYPQETISKSPSVPPFTRGQLSPFPHPNNHLNNPFQQHSTTTKTDYHVIKSPNCTVTHCTPSEPTNDFNNTDTDQNLNSTNATSVPSHVHVLSNASGGSLSVDGPNPPGNSFPGSTTQSQFDLLSNASERNLTMPSIDARATEGSLLKKRWLLPLEDCGQSTDERIVGGKRAALGAYPWVARIGYTRVSSGRVVFRCGGSLINDRYVITAAHCVTKLPGGLQLSMIRLGDVDDRSDPDCNQLECADPVQDFDPVEVKVHPDYDNPRYKNDVALVRLDRPVNITNYVSPICLPFDSLSLKDFTGLKAVVAGWGATSLGVSSGSPTLQWVRLSVVPTAECAAKFAARARIPIGPGQLCAGGESGRDSCEGDSGGPLMRPEQPDLLSPPRFFLVGIVSFGSKNCGFDNLPGVYTRVGLYMDWVLESIQP